MLPATLDFEMRRRMILDFHEQPDFGCFFIELCTGFGAVFSLTYAPDLARFCAPYFGRFFGVFNAILEMFYAPDLELVFHWEGLRRGNFEVSRA